MKTMKKVAAIAVAALSATALLSACSYSPSDPEVQTEYYDQIEFLSRPAETADPSTRYRMARELLTHVDMDSVKSVDQLAKLMGKPTKASGNGSSQTLEYRFVSQIDGDPISAVFQAQSGRIVSSKIVCPSPRED